MPVSTDDTLSQAGTDAIPSQRFHNPEPLAQETARYAEIVGSYKDNRTAGLLYWHDGMPVFCDYESCITGDNGCDQSNIYKYCK